MAYTLDFEISLGSTKTGLTLAGQLVDSSGVAVGAEIAAGFTEIGTGCYILTTSIPDGHRGGIKIYVSGVPAIILAFGSINPEETECAPTVYGLARFANTDTLEVAAVAGSVAELSQCNAAGFPAGSIEYTLTITSPGLIPIAGASVWISTDVGMTNIIWRGVTDTFGVARDVNNSLPWLDAGVYQFWVQDDNWTDSNPTAMVVS